MHAKGIAGANSGLCRIGCDAGGGGRASLLHQGLRFWRRCWRLQFFVAGAVSGDRLRARCVLRCKSLFQREGGNAARSQPPIPKEILMRISGFGNSRNRSDFGGSSGTGPDIRRGISGLPALTCIANPYFVGETEPQSAGCLSAAIRRCLNATRRPRAARRNASSIPIGQMRIRIGPYAGAAFTERCSY